MSDETPDEMEAGIERDHAGAEPYKEPEAEGRGGVLHQMDAAQATGDRARRSIDQLQRSKRVLDSD